MFKEEAKLFSLETIFSDFTFGVHKCWNYIKDSNPEVKILENLQYVLD